MRAEEILKKMTVSFFVIVTGIVCSIYIYCLIFNPDAVFTLADIGRILLMAVAGDLPFFLFLSGRELNKKQMLLRKVVHFVVLSAVLLYLVFRWDWVDPKNGKGIAVFFLTILLVYAAVFFVSRYRDKKLTSKLNERLKERRRS
jgi:hypothetical protein